MKTRRTFFILAFFIISLEGIHAQTGLGEKGVPLKPQSPLFGKDIVIHDSSSQNQRQVKICSAFNGWLYAAYEYFTPKYGGREAIEILKSVDNGITWNIFYDSLGTGSVPFSSFDIDVTGDSVSNIKILLEWVSPNGPIGYGGDGEFVRFDGNGNYLDGIILGGASYIAIGTDFMYPANNSNPNSIGILYSANNMNPNNSKDSLILLSSGNDGLSFNNRQVITISSSHIQNVSLTYGRSPSWSSGRYFATWTETNAFTTFLGHIFTAHSDPDFNSPFTRPVCLDSLDPSGINKFKNPKIACQFSSSDNDSANLSEVVMAEKQLSPNNYDTRGFYNLQAITSNHFNEFSITSSTNNKTEPDINFNPYNSTFMLTYYDSTLSSLPFLTNDVNLANPGTWNIISNAYNDNGNLVSPLPKVDLNYLQQAGMDAWISQRTNGNGVALFDAPYSTYTGVSEINSADNASLIGAYPNPCSNYVKITFEMKETENVTISLMSIIGQQLGTITNQNYSEGRHVVQYDVSDFPQGIYLYDFRAGEIRGSGKIAIVR